MTVVDHPGRQSAELNRRIEAEFGDMECWRASIDIEMILILDFGGRRALMGKRGPVAIGWLRILVHGEDWVAEPGGGSALASRDVLHGGDEGAIDPVFIGRRLNRIEWGSDCSLRFSDGLVLRVGRESERPEHDNIVEFRFPNGDCVDCFANGSIETEAND